MMKTRYPNIFLFTGQGAQYRGMARALYRTEPVFKQWMDDLDRICLEKRSISVTAFLYSDVQTGDLPGEPGSFEDIRMSHPALFMVQFSLAKTLIHYGIIPHYLMGASLGEYVALALAGVMPPRAMLTALIDHAHALGTSCSPGAMIGIADSPGRYDRDPVIRENCHLAGISSPGHFLVSGDKLGMERVRRRLMETDIGFQVLPVRFGFHSPNIEPALSGWKAGLKNLGEMNQPETDVISCCTGTWVKEVSTEYLTHIGRGPILFREALKTLDRELSPSGPGPVNILDLGPGAWSSGFVRQNKLLDGPIRIYRVMTRFGSELKNLKKIKAELTR